MNQKDVTEERAVELFRSGMNCAQAVVASFAEPMKYDPSLATGLSLGFGGGMGRMQKTCGVVTGSYMVLGIHNSRLYPDMKDRKEHTYEMVRSFTDHFTRIHGADDCMSLLKHDLRTEEGQQYIRENQLHEKICEKCMSTAISLVQELTAQQDR